MNQDFLKAVLHLNPNKTFLKQQCLEKRSRRLFGGKVEFYHDSGIVDRLMMSEMVLEVDAGRHPQMN